ncbi:hypothetical protein JOJ86_007424 [Rhodococcus percolatus]|uniref:DUF4192 domain-containing protein n=1 Tax=Rhodococcus opacus TaxID=37919 RepID=UPI0015FA496D|nr:DUF4192 domain-containing protein [Rhodococcus opacus]MBA8965058.1 hypothetical protein [Rhodococcus opacus]MBA8965102.1 hypothetical protein [Rhodococcus opacus]MBP2209631.1 hypothetical protein [Rhodococcus opacus]
MIRLSTATDVLAAIPAMLGFVPVQSIVAILVGESDTDNAARVILAARYDADTDVSSVASQLCGIAVREQATGAVLTAVVGGPGASAALDNMAMLGDGLEAHGARVMMSLHAAEIVEGAQWVNLETLERGAVPDPSTSVAAATRIAEGRSIETTRAAIAARYGIAAEADPRPAREAFHEQGHDFPRATITELAAVARSREIPSADLAARVGMVAAASPQLRDALLSLARYGVAEAHAAMLLVANQLRGAARVQTLTITGMFAYLDGRGTEAGFAFEVARETADTSSEADTGLLDLLDIALQNGIHPHAVAELVTVGVDVAQKLGVELD